jgi:phosphoglycerate dehydrogenase-like enzyme
VLFVAVAGMVPSAVSVQRVGVTLAPSAGDVVSTRIAERLRVPTSWEFWPCEPLPPLSVLRRVEAVILPPEGGRCGSATVLAAVAGAVGNRTASGAPPLVQHMITGVTPETIAATPAEFAVANVHPSSVPLAEYVLAAMLQSVTSLPSLDARFRECTWKTAPPGNHGCPSMSEMHGALFGTTMCILGYGNIGIEVAKRAAAFGVTVSSTTADPLPDIPPSPLQRLAGPSREDAEACVAESDFVVIALPLNRATVGLVDADMLSKMKPNAMLINPARGGIVDEQALFNALRNDVIHAAALDVWWRDVDTLSAEQPMLPWMQPNATGTDSWPSRFRFDQLPEVIMTPHLAARTNVESTARFAQVAQQLDRLAQDEPPDYILRSGNVPFPTELIAQSARSASLNNRLVSDDTAVAVLAHVRIVAVMLVSLGLGVCFGKCIERRAWRKAVALDGGPRWASEERSLLAHTEE